MCYSGNCIYEDYMGDCRAPNNIKNPCKKGNRFSKINIAKEIMRAYKWRIRHYTKYVFNKKYREEYKKAMKDIDDFKLF